MDIFMENTMGSIISIRVKLAALLQLVMVDLLGAEACHLPVEVEEPLVVVAVAHVNFKMNVKVGELWILFYGL